jgi:DNA repair exonuclease SbcCD ATPase subunit
MAKEPKNNRTQYSESKMKLGISITPTGKELLNEMAKTTKLSRSELIERMSRGYISVKSELTNTILTLDFESKPAENNGAGNEGKFPVLKSIAVSQVSSQEAPPTSADLAELNQALAEKEKSLATLQEKLNLYQKEASRVALLKQQVAEKEYTISELQGQVKQLQQTQEAVKNDAEGKNQEAIAAWQEKVTQQEQTIAQLQAQVNELEQTHEALKKTTVAKEHYEALQAQLSQAQDQQNSAALISRQEYEALERKLQQHCQVIDSLQSQLQSMKTPHAKETELRSQLYLQQQTIQGLEEKMQQMQQFSSIGEYHLNRWRTHTF